MAKKIIKRFASLLIVLLIPPSWTLPFYALSQLKYNAVIEEYKALELEFWFISVQVCVI